MLSFRRPVFARHGSLRAAICLLILCVLAPLWSAAAPIPARERTFTVRDSIALQHVVEFLLPDGVRSTALWSPDRSRFLLRTRRGELDRNVNIETVHLYDAKEVDGYLNMRAAAAPRGRVLMRWDVQFTSGSDFWAGLHAIRWNGNEEISFIAPGENGRNQAFLLDVASGLVTQLTRAETDIVSFELSGDTVVYWARVNRVLPPFVVVGHQSLFELLQPEQPMNFPLVDLYKGSRMSFRAERVDMPTVRIAWPWLRIWLEPRGDYAVILAPSANAPDHWSEYAIRADDDGLAADYNYSPARVTNDPTSLSLRYRTRYQLVDLRTLQARPLLDAPSGVGVYEGLTSVATPLNVFWPPDRRSVVVSNTFLPLSVNDTDVRAQRRASPAIAEIDLKSGAITPIAWTALNRAGSGDSSPTQVVDVLWDGAASALEVASLSDDGAAVHSRYQREQGAWKISRTVDRRERDRLSIELQQSLHQRPRVYARSMKCGCAKELLDPAPEADAFSFGRVESFEWTTPTGSKWRGGLVLPVGYAAGSRYPVVVQTHGFSANEFLIDGPGGFTTAMAAQPLANAGIAVLQVEDKADAMTLDAKEASLFAEGYASGAAALVSRGIADPERIGLIAFSRTGLGAIRLLADQPESFAAVTLADAPWWGYMIDVLLANATFADGTRAVTGGSPAPTALNEWIERNPMYRLGRSRAAFRIEANGGDGPLGLLGLWEHYVVLQKSGRPVDFVYFPHGSHVLVKPAERLASQQGNVDWFRFSLQCYEDPDPRKAEQYLRWRTLGARCDRLRQHGHEK